VMMALRPAWVLLAREGVRTESVNWEAAGATVRLADDCAQSQSNGYGFVSHKIIFLQSAHCWRGDHIVEHNAMSIAKIGQRV
jgi:hypothetical protein